MILQVNNTSIFNQYYLLKYHILVIIILICCTLLFTDLNSSEITFICVFSIGFSLFLILISIPLLLQYFKVSKNVEFNINDREIKVMNNGVIKIYLKDDIKFILYVRAASIDPPFSFPRTLFEAFHFMKIYFNNGESIVITSLFANDLTKVIQVFDSVKIVRVKKLLCTIDGDYSDYITSC